MGPLLIKIGLVLCLLTTHMFVTSAAVVRPVRRAFMAQLYNMMLLGIGSLNLALSSVTQIAPIEREVVFEGQTCAGYVLEFVDGSNATTEMTLVAKDGGHIISYALDGVNIIVDTPVGPSQVDGSTFWISPQSTWGWPPPASFDSVTFKAEVDKVAGAVTFIGPVDRGLQTQLQKRFYLDLERGAIMLKYSILNMGTMPQSFAPWEITRLWPGGLTFYPTGPGEVESGQFRPLPVEQSLGTTWFAHNSSELILGGGFKHIAYGRQGWLAHALAEEGLIFLKQFEEVSFGAAAPGEAPIEIFALDSYEELEVQGAYTEVPPSGRLDWTVSWMLHRIPPNASSIPGDSALLAFVENLVCSSTTSFQQRSLFWTIRGILYVTAGVAAIVLGAGLCKNQWKEAGWRYDYYVSLCA